MNEPRVDVIQLQKRDPAAWSALLSSHIGLEDVVVTAVTAQPLRYNASASTYSRRVTRYLLSLDNHTDPITFIGKRTTPFEAYFYRDLADQLPFVAPRCWFLHVAEDVGWVILDDVPNHVHRDDWTAVDIDDALRNLAQMHAKFWGKIDLQTKSPWLTHFIDKQEITYTFEDLRHEQSQYFEEGPAALLSEHAIQNSGRLAPRLLAAANGLIVMRDLGGWPGVLGESHLAAAADLIDDPVPILEPLLNLPITLLHGNPHTYHWHLTLFDEQRLLDWRDVTTGPGICDLVNFQEQFHLLYARNGTVYVHVRHDSPATVETIIDSYILSMKAELGSNFDARAFRLALPAARCLHVILNWFPMFASWFDQMPSKFTWQRVNRMSDAELIGTSMQPLIGYRPYLRTVFQRFLQAYRML